MPKSVVRVRIRGLIVPPVPSKAADGSASLRQHPSAFGLSVRSRAARLVDRRDPGRHPAARVEVSHDLHLPRLADLTRSSRIVLIECS